MFKFLFSQLNDFRLIAKYVISGLIAAFSQLLVLFFLVEKLNMWHIQGVIIAFIFSATVAFTLQKFWTFKDPSMDGAHIQITYYAVLVLIALSLNIIFMYVFVDIFHIWYIIAQVVAIGLVTIVTFLSNKYIIFSKHKRFVSKIK